MKLIQIYNIQFAIFLFAILFIILWPLYLYIFDVDGIGYGMVAKRLAAGEYSKALNGYWSPFHSWIIIPFLKMGVAIDTAFKISNGILGIGTLIILHFLTKKFELNNTQRTSILFTSVVMLLHYCYFQLAADILLVPLLLLFVNLILSENFFQNFKIQILAALVATLCYLAKAYALPVIVLIYSALAIHNWYQTRKFQWSYIIVFFGTFFLSALPWIVLVSNKYQFLTFGTSGKLNWTWYLGGAVNTQNFFHLPVYENSPSWWEDPYWACNQFLTMFSSTEMFLHQLRVIAFNTMALLKTYSEISVFTAAVLLGMFLKSMKKENSLLQKLFIFTILFPAGYLLNHIETRFFWVFGFIVLIVGTILINELLNKTQLHPKLKWLITILFYLSFLIEPINSLKDSANTGKEVYELATYFKTHSFQGNFASNSKQGECQVTAFLSNSRFYFISQQNYNYAQLKTEMSKHKVPTFLYYYKFEYEKESAIATFTEQEFTSEQPRPGLIIFTRKL